MRAPAHPLIGFFAAFLVLLPGSTCPSESGRPPPVGLSVVKANRRYDFWIRVPCSSCPGPRSASGPQLDSLDQPFASDACRCEARSDANAVHSVWRNGQRDRRARGVTTSVIAVRCHAGIRDEPGEIEGEPRASPAADARTKRTSTPTTRAQADLVLKQGNSKVSPP